MFKLIKLELKRNNLKSYIMSTIIISVIMLGFIYLFAYAPNIDSDPELQIFKGYTSIITLYSVLSLVIFAVLSAVMYTKFIVEEYKDKRAVLLFTYPISRKKILLSKILVVFLFTVLAMFICNLFVYSIFGISESLIPLVEGSFNLEMISIAFKNTLLYSILASQIGIISAGIGFIKKSIPTTIISSILISSFICNLTASPITVGSGNTSIPIVFTSIILIFGIITTFLLMNKVNTMEV